MPDALNQTTHYVKFRRGSIAVWNTLIANPAQIDDDTLYFIYDTTINNPTEGKLYLGQKLISGVGDGSTGDIINLNDLNNVSIDGTSLSDKEILVYNETTQRWENTSLSTIINTAVGEMIGATEQDYGSPGLVPLPAPGDNSKFLRGDGTWSSINIPTFDSNVFTLNSNQVSLLGFNLAPVGTVPVKTASGIQWSNVSTSRLNRTITTLQKLQDQVNGIDPEPLDENMIYLVDNGSVGTGSKYDEYIIVNGEIEKVGSFGQVDLTNYVTIPTFTQEINRLDNILQDTTDSLTGGLVPGLISRVTTIEATYVTQFEIGNLSDLILSPGNDNLVEEVNSMNVTLADVKERLKWKDLQED